MQAAVVSLNEVLRELLTLIVARVYHMLACGRDKFGHGDHPPYWVSANPALTVPANRAKPVHVLPEGRHWY
jgi:hypothetical protein